MGYRRSQKGQVPSQPANKTMVFLTKLEHPALEASIADGHAIRSGIAYSTTLSGRIPHVLFAQQ